MAAVGVLAFIAAAGALIWPVTDLIAAHDVGAALTGVARAQQLQTAREAVRTQLLTLGAGVFAAGALVFTARNFALTRQGQVSDRYSRAIDQLGSDKVDVRIGGVYSLERVGRDSPEDHAMVMEVLCAFIREHSGEQVPPAGDDDRPRLAADVQAALTVVGRRNAELDIPVVGRSRAMPVVDLSRAVLHGAILDFGNFSGASFYRADLSQATCAGADLGGAVLIDAKLTGAFLGVVIFGGREVHVNLSGAYLLGADLTGADLTGADLGRARLDGAFLLETNLTRADLRAADLTGVHFRDPDLTGALWPEAVSVPAGWLLDPDGRLKPSPEDAPDGQSPGYPPGAD